MRVCVRALDSERREEGQFLGQAILGVALAAVAELCRGRHESEGPKKGIHFQESQSNKTL